MEHSISQIALAIFFTWTAVAWLYAEFLHSRRRKPQKEDEVDEENVSGKRIADVPVKALVTNGAHIAKLVTLRPAAIVESRLVLRAWSELGLVLFMFYALDRTTLFTGGGKSYSRDVFFFICLIVLFVSAYTSTHSCKPTLLNRDQTEEWKGWMQIMFLLYHYFEAKELYNAIRIFIAAYVWMTGFGNFSYYYVRQDFSLGRFCQMMWRLNFFVVFCCIALRNSYVLYYICPMHTLFTLVIYGVLGVAPKYNGTNAGVAAKFLFCFLFVFVVWDVPGVFKALWGPLGFLVNYTDPKKPDVDPLHEWFFRSGLDRYVWIYGMMCAYMHPACERALLKMEELSRVSGLLAKGVLLSVVAGIGMVWYQRVYTLDKFSYNAVHPYTSWIPITIWCVLRNIAPQLRGKYIEFLAWMGRITLETYISQFHVWLYTGVPDGQPGKLMVLLQGYPLLNFMAATIIYVVISRRIFDVTNTLKNVCVPLSDNKLLMNNLVMAACCTGLLLVSALILSSAVAF